ncbi:MAG: type 4a pilus biogenesis protein PilO [bacterium]
MNKQIIKFAINVLLLLVVLLGLTFGIIVPSFNAIINDSKKVSIERLALEKKIAANSDIKKTKAQLEEVEKQINQLDKIYIIKNHELEFINYLDNLSTKNGITASFNPDFTIANNAKKNIQTIPLRINASGDYAKLMLWLQSIEAMPYYFNIDEINFSNQATDANLQNIQLAGRVYLK